MSDNRQLAVLDFDTQQRQAMALYKSGYFKDATSEAQAIVKVMAGQELGLPPFASMTAIHIIKGKPVLGANAIATLIKNDRRYNYVVEEHTDKICVIVFYESGNKVGTSIFTAADAKRAGTQNMGKFPRNMLFARAISNGAKWYVPGIFGGMPVYAPEDFDIVTDEDGGIVEGQVIPEAPNVEYHIQDENGFDLPPDEGDDSQQAQQMTPLDEFQHEVLTNESAQFIGICTKHLAPLREGYAFPNTIKKRLKQFGYSGIPGKPEQRVAAALMLFTYVAMRNQDISADDTLATIMEAGES